MRRRALTTLAASIALLGGAGASAFLPLASRGCPTAVRAVLAEPVQAEPSEAPVQNPEEVAADTAAIEAARLVVADATSRSRAAQVAVTDAQSTVPGTGYGTSGVSYGRAAAQSSLDRARQEVASAQDALTADLAARNSYPTDDPMYAVNDDLVAEDRAVLEAAKRELTDAQGVLAGVADAQDAIDSATTVFDQTAVELAAAQGALDSVRAVQQEHQAAFAVVYAGWQAGEEAARVAAAEADGERRACREDGRNRLILAGVVAVVGGALGSYSFVHRR